MISCSLIVTRQLETSDRVKGTSTNDEWSQPHNVVSYYYLLPSITEGFLGISNYHENGKCWALKKVKLPKSGCLWHFGDGPTFLPLLDRCSQYAIITWSSSWKNSASPVSVAKSRCLTDGLLWVQVKKYFNYIKEHLFGEIAIPISTKGLKATNYCLTNWLEENFYSKNCPKSRQSIRISKEASWPDCET